MTQDEELGVAGCHLLQHVTDAIAFARCFGFALGVERFVEGEGIAPGVLLVTQSALGRTQGVVTQVGGHAIQPPPEIVGLT